MDKYTALVLLMKCTVRYIPVHGEEVNVQITCSALRILRFVMAILTAMINQMSCVMHLVFSKNWITTRQ